jgi:hypothetical protein
MPDPRLGQSVRPEGQDLYAARWWDMRMKGIVLRPWRELPTSIRCIWDQRAASVSAEPDPTSRGQNV